VILIFYLKAGYECILEKFINDSEEKPKQNLMQLRKEQLSELGTVFKEASKNLIFILS
jgi:hypothetical protein